MRLRFLGGETMKLVKTLSLLVAASAIATPQLVQAQARQAKPTNAQQLQNQAMSEVPKCARKLGTLSIVDGDDPRGWQQYNLAPPQKLLRVIVQRSGCFNLVDRAAGMNAAVAEREIGAGLGLQRGSNVGQGQVKAADYVLVAEVQAADGNAAGSALAAGVAGRLIGGQLGGVVGGIRTKKIEANTVLSLTNVRTTETVAVQDGYAAKTDISFGGGAGGGGAVFGGLVGGGYESTETGRIVTLAFLQAYNKMVTELGLLSADAPAQAAPTKTFTATAVLNMRRGPDAQSPVIRALQPGAIVYPTGKKADLWWEVADENDNVGWVLYTKLEPSR